MFGSDRAETLAPALVDAPVVAPALGAPVAVAPLPTAAVSARWLSFLPQAARTQTQAAPAMRSTLLGIFSSLISLQRYSGGTCVSHYIFWQELIRSIAKTAIESCLWRFKACQPGYPSGAYS